MSANHSASVISRALSHARRIDAVKHWRWLLLSTLLIAIVARCISYAVVIDDDYIERTRSSDYPQYADIARNLVAGNGFLLYNQPNIRRAPGFPVFLAVIYKVFGESTRPVIIANALLTVGIVLLTGFLGRRIVNERVGVVAALLIAVNPVQVKYGLTPLSEPLFTILVLAGVLCITPLANQHNWKRVVIGGAFVGLACLVRSSIIILPAFLGVWWVWRLRWRGIAMTALFSVTMLAVIAPWTVRNWHVTEMLIPVNKMDGHVLWVSNNPVMWEDRVNWGNAYENVGPGMQPRKSIERQIATDNTEKELAISFLRENIRRIPFFITMKFARFFSLLTQIPIHLKLALYALDVILIPISVFGIGILIRAKVRTLGPALAVIMATLVAVAIFWGDSRFRFPIVPYYTVFAGVVIIRSWARFSTSRSEVDQAELARS